MPADQRGPGAVITGIGLSSSMGGALTACAAARAGLSRPAELDYQVEDDESGMPEAVSGHPVPSIAGFVGRARMIALGEAGLADLMSRSPDLGKDGPVGLHLCLPNPDVRRWDPELRPDSRAAREQLRAEAEGRDQVAEQLLELGGLSVPPAARRVYAAGETGLVAAIDDALALFARAQLDACLVGAVDSLIDPAVLSFFFQAGRLKTPDDSNGLIPGEAGAFLLLERADLARQLRRPILARVAATATEQGEDPDVVERPPRGAALVSLFTRLMGAGPPPGGSFWVLTDQNGETYKALEWADFVIRARGRVADPGPLPLWYPAISFGDTGAASGALAACMAIRAFSRNYAPASTAIIVSGMYEGTRSGLRIEAPSARG